jgi:hypothetical protein
VVPADAGTSVEPTGAAAAQPSDERALGDLYNLGSINTNPYALSVGSFQSYRLRARWLVEPKGEGGEPATAVEFQMAYIREPLAEEIAFSDSGQGVSTRLIHVGDRLWVESGGQWTELPTEDSSSLDRMLSAFDAVVADLDGNAHRVGDENVYGVITRHYTFDRSTLGASADAYSEITGDVWVAAEGSYLIKYTFTAQDEAATYRWEWDVFDINAGFKIAPPPDVP